MYESALRMLGGAGANIDTTNMPPTHMGPSLAGVCCCPLIGGVAVCHAMRVRQAWEAHEYTRAHAHSIMVCCVMRPVILLAIFCSTRPCCFVLTISVFPPPPFPLPPLLFLQAQKLASSAVFYGMIFLLLILVVVISKKHNQM